MSCNYESIKKWSKILSYACACGVIGLGIAKFFTVVGVLNPIDYIINIYLM